MGESAWQKEESGVGNIYYGATSACVGIPPLTDMEQGIRDPRARLSEKAKTEFSKT